MECPSNQNAESESRREYRGTFCRSTRVFRVHGGPGKSTFLGPTHLLGIFDIPGVAVRSWNPSSPSGLHASMFFAFPVLRRPVGLERVGDSPEIGILSVTLPGFALCNCRGRDRTIAVSGRTIPVLFFSSPFLQRLIKCERRIPAGVSPSWNFWS